MAGMRITGHINDHLVIPCCFPRRGPWPGVDRCQDAVVVGCDKTNAGCDPYYSTPRRAGTLIRDRLVTLVIIIYLNVVLTNDNSIAQWRRAGCVCPCSKCAEGLKAN
jgi:hypothetical protein